MSIKQVGMWLRANGFEEHVELFAKEKIDGNLMVLMNESDLERIGMKSFAKRRTLLMAIFRCNTSQTASALISVPAATSAGITMQQQKSSGVGGRFGRLGNEGVTYMGLLEVSERFKPSAGKTCKDVVMGSAGKLKELGIPLIERIVEDCEQVYISKKTSGAAQSLVCVLSSLYFLVSFFPESKPFLSNHKNTNRSKIVI